MRFKSSLKSGALLLVNLLLSGMSFLIPKDDKLILFGAAEGVKFIGNPKYMFLFLHNRNEGHKIQWITKDKDTYHTLKKRLLPVLYLYSWDAFSAILRAKYLMISHSVVDVSYSYLLPGRFTKIETWHGSPIKCIGKHDRYYRTPIEKMLNIATKSLERRSYHTILASSAEVQRILKSAFENNRIEVLGYPRNDVFFDRNLFFCDYERELNLERYDKVILYCPTFRDTATPSAFSENFLFTLSNKLREKKHVFLAKGHFGKNDIDIHEFPNIIDVSHTVEDVQELLTCTDILITDYSSVVFDFILLDKPIIFYAYDLDLYLRTSRKMYYDYYKDFPGPFARNEEELLTTLLRIDELFKDHTYKKEYQAFKLRFNRYVKGGYCQLLYDHLNL